jgi:rRNA-processing protein FCF1
MEVLLDTSFIVSCVKQKIAFVEQLRSLGLTPVVPREVIQELKDLAARDGVRREDKVAVDVALAVLEKEKVKKGRLGSGKVDDGLIAKGQEGIWIASLDKEIKRNVVKKIVIFTAEKKVGPE